MSPYEHVSYAYKMTVGKGLHLILGVWLRRITMEDTWISHGDRKIFVLHGYGRGEDSRSTRSEGQMPAVASMVVQGMCMWRTSSVTKETPCAVL